MTEKDVKIIDVWRAYYGDIRCAAILYEDKKAVGKIIASYDESAIENIINTDDLNTNTNSVKDALRKIIKDSFDYYAKLPKISKCSKLLQTIYDEVCSSELTVCHISEDDWEKYYMYSFSYKDIEKLEEEIKKYNLKDLIEINYNNFKIIGYGDLEIRFNDDRGFLKSKEMER